MAKRMQRLIAASNATLRTTGVDNVRDERIVPCPARDFAHRFAPISRSFRQAFRALDFPRFSAPSAPSTIREKPRHIRRNPEFRNAARSIATPVRPAVAHCACLKGIEKICVVTSNDAEFVR
ncbi:tyrosine-protein phosphatase [Pandoraea capi]|uniref:tyrosine-protein phosphatase n=1 Tax=Pandoraea capi TaxID=2508286 RepID=UPI001240A1F1|nr:tyrosine-protein phosphatase [Pandoraea capi]